MPLTASTQAKPAEDAVAVEQMVAVAQAGDATRANSEPTPPGNATFPLTLYYDASCPLCLAEMQALKRSDAANRLRLVDCSAPGFTDPHSTEAGISVESLMRRLHARDAAGRWSVGVPAFAVAYGAVGVAGVAAFFADARWARVLARAYGWIADHRQGLSRLGLNGLFGAWVGWMARRAHRRATTCHDGVCATAVGKPQSSQA